MWLAPEEGAAPVQRGRRVLVVDDDVWVRTTLAEVLEYAGYDVVMAQNGADARAAMHFIRPDCVVLDLIMPVLDGWHFLRACRRDALCASTPVLVVSASSSLAAAVRSEFRIEHILIKPFDVDALLEAVKHLLELAL
jgi:DNA-binding response OmpR family regulator